MENELVIGELKIASGVLEKMVRESVMAVEGVSGLKKVVVAPEGKGLKIDLHATLHHTSVYPEVAEKVQQKVSGDVNGMTGIEDFVVNVYVDKLDFGKE